MEAKAALSTTQGLVYKKEISPLILTHNNYSKHIPVKLRKLQWFSDKKIRIKRFIFFYVVWYSNSIVAHIMITRDLHGH